VLPFRRSLGRCSSNQADRSREAPPVSLKLDRVLWPIGILGLAGRMTMASRSEGADLLQVWSAVHDFLHRLPPYRARPWVLPFPYPPSALLLMSPLGLADFASAKVVFAVVNALAIAVAGWLCLEMFGMPWRSRAGAVTLIGVCLFSPAIQTLNTGNINGLVLAAEAAALLAASRDRWLWAGAALGLGFAIKPVLLPLVLLFALWRRWAALAVALAIPLAGSALALSLAVDGGQYVSHTIPGLLAGPGPRHQSENVALTRLFYLAGPSADLAVWPRMLLAALALGILWRRRPTKDAEPLRLVEVASLILLATFLGHSFAWPHYAVYLLPLVVSVVHPASAMRTWTGLAGLYGIGMPDLRLWLLGGPLGFVLVHLRFTAGFALLFIAVARALWTSARAGCRSASRL
jgi:arabinofuranan 3-O-arabinosyltransferase